jgi:hypothetical protein
VPEQVSVPYTGKRAGITLRNHSVYQSYTRSRCKNAYHFINSAGQLGAMHTLAQAQKADRLDLEYQREVRKKHSKHKISLNTLQTVLKKTIASNPKLKGKDLGSVYTIPSSHPGSRAFYNQAYADLLKVVEVHGAPTL